MQKPVFSRRGSFTSISVFGSTAVFKLEMSHVTTKLVFGVSDQVRHNPGIKATEDDYRLEIWNLGRRGIVPVLNVSSYISKKDKIKFYAPFKSFSPDLSFRTQHRILTALWVEL